MNVGNTYINNAKVDHDAKMLFSIHGNNFVEYLTGRHWTIMECRNTRVYHKNKSPNQLQLSLCMNQNMSACGRTNCLEHGVP